MTGRSITTPPPARPEPSRRDREAIVGLDRVVAAYYADVDETILIENLRLTPQERFDKFVRFMRFVAAVRGAARAAEPAAGAAAAGVDRSSTPHGRA